MATTTQHLQQSPIFNNGDPLPSKDITDAYGIQWRHDAYQNQWRRASPIPINGVGPGTATWTLSYPGEERQSPVSGYIRPALPHPTSLH